MLNHITIMGRLTRDPELRRTGAGIAVASFSVAVDRDFGGKDGAEKETDFIDCVAWRSTGEFVSKYFRKGDMIVVSGRLQIRSWTDKEGNKRRTAEVVADNCYFGQSKRDNAGGQAAGSYQAPADPNYGYNAPAAPAPGGYAAPAPGGYAAPAPGYNQPNYGGYSAPAGASSEFAMLDDDDAQLPF
jgi:single-strand DNA-binding protein